jgi:hypothetical protein
VEEQFYLLFPLLHDLVADPLWGSRIRTGVLILMLLLSLGLAQVCWYSPSRQRLFFLLPTRGWEISAGGAGGVLFRSPVEGQYRAWRFVSLLGGIGLVDDPCYRSCHAITKNPFPRMDMRLMPAWGASAGDYCMPHPKHGSGACWVNAGSWRHGVDQLQRLFMASTPVWPLPDTG